MLRLPRVFWSRGSGSGGLSKATKETTTCIPSSTGKIPLRFFSSIHSQTAPAAAAALSTLPSYHEEFTRSIEHMEDFWAEKAQQVKWFKKWDRVLDSSEPPLYRWFGGGKVNTCYNALDYHIEQGRGDQLALIYDSPVTNTVKRYTYKELYEQVTLFAGVLAGQHGVEKGDRVLIYMPMIPEAVIAMLACARLGAIHSVVFGGFAADQLAARIDHSRAKVVVSASCGIEPTHNVEYKPLLDRAIEISRFKPHASIIFQRPNVDVQVSLNNTREQQDFDWESQISKARPHTHCAELESTDPLYILYTSGTTGNPKGVVRDNAGHLVSLKYSMKTVFGLDPGDVWWAASDIGWVVGHSYIVYGPLVHGCTSVLYEGKPVGTPDSGAYWRVLSDHGVNSCFFAPTAIRAIKREDPHGKNVAKYDLSKFRAMFVAGERADPATVHWAEELMKGKPIIDHWWQTETGWPMSAKCLGLNYGADEKGEGKSHVRIRYGSCGKPVPGYDIRILDQESGKEIPKGHHLGEVVVKAPLPPGTFSTLWPQDNEKYVNTYFKRFPGHYQAGDAGFIDRDGFISIMARTDDVINVAGHRLSTGALEEVMCNHRDVAESAVIGAVDPIKGEVPLGFIVLKSGVSRPNDEIVKEVIQKVRNHIGPVASFKIACVVDRLPKTRSGKVLRGTMKKIADGCPYQTPPTIDDPLTLTEIERALSTVGYPLQQQQQHQHQQQHEFP